MIDPDSPFAGLPYDQQPSSLIGRTIHVCFCDSCHHVWKAPAAASACVNCNNAQTPPRSLASYVGDVPIG